MSGICMSRMATSKGSPRVDPLEGLGRTSGPGREHPPGLGLPGQDSRFVALSSTISTRLPARCVASDRSNGRTVAGALWATIVKWKVEPTPTRLSAHIVAAHQLRESPADGQPEPGPAVAARRRAIDLAERLEQTVHPVLGDADPGVADREVEPVPVARVEPLGAGRDHHLPALGELDRVVQQVDQDLPQPRDVADDGARRRRVEVVGEVEPLLQRARGATSSSADSTHSRRSNGAPLQVEPAGLDLGEVQDVVDDGEQGVAAAADRPRRSSRCSASSSVSSRSPVMPITALSGVRISWLMVARNALLASVAASASRRACWSSRMSWYRP